MKRHEIVQRARGWFACLGCAFDTDNLTDVARHVVAHQFEVRS